MNKRIDLHCHTTCSDGTDTPAGLVEQAKSLGLAAVAITDHDTLDGHAEALAAGEKLGVEVVPGVELSSMYRGEHIHLLAYWADAGNETLRGLMECAVIERIRRNERIVQKLQAAGFPIDMETLRREHPRQTMLGRPHIAAHLMRLGYVKSVREGVIELMGKGKPFHVDRYHIPLVDYIGAVRAAGGVPVIAHLYQYKLSDDERREMIREATDHGLLGLEGMYSTYTPEQQENVFRFAREFGLICTGGSDYHGGGKPNIALGTGFGNLSVPYALLEDLKKAREIARGPYQLKV